MRDDDEGSDSGSSGIVGPVVSSIASRGDKNATFVKELENQHLRDLVLGSVGAVGHRCTREDTLCASLPAKVQYQREGSGDEPGEDEPASIAGHNARAAPVAGDAGVELGVEQPDGQRCDGLKWMSLVSICHIIMVTGLMSSGRQYWNPLTSEDCPRQRLKRV
jgi:hypothetical protein